MDLFEYNKWTNRYGKPKGKDGSWYNMSIPLLSERPGLQNLTYYEVIDFNNSNKIIDQMCHKAMEQRDSLVYDTLEFLTDKLTLTSLYTGQKPSSVMIDSRTVKQFAKIKIN